MLPTICTAAVFFAQSPPLSTDQWSNGLFAILILLIIVVAVSTVWKNLRPEPSLQKQVDQKISEANTLLELRIEKKLDALQLQIGGRETDIRELRNSMTKAIEDLNRAIGRLEGTSNS